MKHARKRIITFLLLIAFLLSACGQTAPAPTPEPEDDSGLPGPVELDSRLALQPIRHTMTSPDTAKKQAGDLFRAKFEGTDVAGSGEAVDGVYRFIATKTDGESWHVKLESNYPTLAGRDYRVTYRFRSDVAGKVKFGDFQEFDIQAGDNEVTGILTAAGGTSYLDLQLGMLDPFTIDFTEIEVEEYADMTDYEDALTAPVDFQREARVYERHDQGYGALITRGKDQVALNYVAVPWESEIWKARLYVNTGLIPEGGVHYLVTVDVLCDEDMPFEILFNDGETEKAYGALYGQQIKAGEVTTCQAVITGKGAVDDLVLQFSIGQVPEGSIVQVGNLHVEKIIDHYTSQLQDDFALDKIILTGRTLYDTVPVGYTPIALNAFSYTGKDTVYEGHDDDYEVSLEEASSSATLKITKAPASDRGVWKARLYAATGVTLEADTTYRIKFDLQSARDQAEYEACFDGNAENAYGALYGRSLKAGKNTVEYIVTPTESQGPLTVRLQLGKTDSTAGNNVTLSNLTVEKLAPQAKPLASVSLSTGSEGNVREEHYDGVEQTLTVSGASAALNVTQGRTEGGVWSSKLLINTGVTPEAGQRYRVSAKVDATADTGDFEILYQNAAASDLYGGQWGLSGADTYSADFTAPTENCGELVLVFQLGNTAANNTITVSDLQVCPMSGGTMTDVELPDFAYPVTEEGGTENNSFDLEANSGAAAELTGDGSSATATVTTPGDDWHVKLYAKPGLELEKDQTYTITMDVTGADGCQACYKNTATGAEDGFGTETIGSGTVTHTVTAAENGTLEILLKIGNVPAGTAVKVSNVHITKTTTDYIPVELPDFGYPTVIEGSTENNSFDLEANSGAAAELTGDGSSATATVTTPGDDWHVKFYAKPGVTLEAGKTYRITMNVTGADGCQACYKNTATGAEDGFGTETIGSGTVTHTVTAAENGTLEILLKIGNVPAGTAVTISDVEIAASTETASDAMPSPISYPNSFDLEANSGAAAELTGDGSSATATVTTPGDDWNVKFYVKPHVQFEAGKTYRVSLRVTNASGCPVCFKDLASGNEEGFGVVWIGSADETVTHTVTPSESGEMEILLKIGNVSAGTAVTVSDIRVSELKTEFAPETLSGFGYPVTVPASTENNSFDLEANSGAAAELTGDGSSATATVTVPGDDWHVKFYVKPELKLKDGTTYQISMKVTGAEGCTACYKNTITGAEDGYGTETIGSADETVTHIVTAGESGPMEILLKIGNVKAGTAVTIRDVQIAEYTTGELDVTPEAFAYPVTAPAATEYNSFDLEANNGAGATLSGDGSAATVTVTTPGDDWHIKFYAKPGVELEAGQTYEITMNVTGADGCQACYKNTATGAEDGFGTETVGSGTLTHTVTAGESGTLEILLKLGTLPAGSVVSVSDVSIRKLSDETPGENLMTGELTGGDAGNVNFWAHEDYAAALTGGDGSASMAINNAPADGREPWKVKLFVETGLDLTAGKTYRIYADVASSKDLDYEICYNNGAVEKGVGALYGLHAASGAKTVTYEVTPENDAELILQFSLGNAVSGTTVTVSNVKVEEVELGAGESVLSGFRYDSVGNFSAAADAGYITTLAQNSSSVTFRILQAPAERNPWNVKLNVRTGFTPQTGKGYRVSFDIDSASRQDLFEVFYDGSAEAAYGQLFEQSLSAGKKTVSYIIMPGDSRGELTVQIRLGKTNTTGGNTYTISNLKIDEVTFTTTATPEEKAVTELWTHETYQSTLEKKSDKAIVRIGKIPAEGREPWKTKLFVETGVDLKAGQKYRVAMDVKSIVSTPFEICFNDGDVEKGLGGLFGLVATPTGEFVEYVTYPKQDTHLVIQLSLGNCAPPNRVILGNVRVDQAGETRLVSDTTYTF